MSGANEASLVLCVAEDRATCEPGVRLLLESLDRAEPGCKVVLFCPFADERFLRFAAGLKRISVDVRTVRPAGAYSWNTKPQALLQILGEGADEVVWLDSDLIVTSGFVGRFSHLDNSAIVVTEEALWGAADDSDALRARLWGFEVGRRFPFTLNSAVLRVTRRHAPLLERWRTLLESQAYRTEQARPWNSRPVNMVGDQDVLTALLCAREFSDIPVEILRRGSGIIQYFGLYGFTMGERVRWLLFGPPPFVHSQGVKAWAPPSPVGRRSLRAYLAEGYLDASPYTMLAWTIGGEPWTKARTRLGAFLRAIGFQNPALSGMPIACAADMIRMTHTAIGRKKAPVSTRPEASANGLS